jgi:hypothetical protein
MLYVTVEEGWSFIIFTFESSEPCDHSDSAEVLAPPLVLCLPLVSSPPQRPSTVLSSPRLPAAAEVPQLASVYSFQIPGKRSPSRISNRDASNATGTYSGFCHRPRNRHSGQGLSWHVFTGNKHEAARAGVDVAQKILARRR